ncbi:MAG: beta-lactamase family protein [Rubrivivax sp.]|nr:beta-lactamase family protein [Rubrivivax sp.]
MTFPHLRRPRAPFAALLASLALGAPGTLPAQAAPRFAERLDRVIDRWVADERIVGVVALVHRAGRPVYRRAAGHADREAGRPATEDTIFHLASLSKLFTSATALALVDRGLLGLDDPVHRWLPYFTPRLPDGTQPTITVRQLMSHTSGLSYAFQEPPGSPYHRLAVTEGLAGGGKTLGQALRDLAAAPLVSAPGTQWRYSMSTDVLGAIIEKVTGLSLPQAVARHVSAPLGLADTGFGVVDRTRLAVPYRDGDPRAVRMRACGDTIPMGPGIQVSPQHLLDTRASPWGGAGMSGTARDFMRLLEALRTGGAPILSPRSMRHLSTHRIGHLRAWTEGEGWGFGLGAAVLLDPRAARTPQHAGTWQWGGVLGSHWFVDPQAELSVVVMTNTAVAGVIGEFPQAIRYAIYDGIASARP